MSSFIYPHSRYLHLAGDTARCGCHIERETGALVMCEACERRAEIEAERRQQQPERSKP